MNDFEKSKVRNMLDVLGLWLDTLDGDVIADDFLEVLEEAVKIEYIQQVKIHRPDMNTEQLLRLARTTDVREMILGSAYQSMYARTVIDDELARSFGKPKAVITSNYKMDVFWELDHKDLPLITAKKLAQMIVQTMTGRREADYDNL